MLLGVCCAGFGVSLPDPYLGDTILSAILPLSAGVIVPSTIYPAWLRTLFRMMPMTGTLTVLSDQKVSHPIISVAGDLFAAAAWAAVGLVFVRLAVARLRHGSRREVI